MKENGKSEGRLCTDFGSVSMQSFHQSSMMMKIVILKESKNQQICIL